MKFRGYQDANTTLTPEGSVRYVTFYEPVDYAVRLFGTGQGIVIENNIVVDTVDTGPDFMYLTGYSSGWLPTGASFALSLQDGNRNLFDNWSYHKRRERE